MDTFAAISERRSIKKFDFDHQFTESEIERLMNAVILTPTSFNIQNWRFVVITDQDQKQKVRDAGCDIVMAVAVGKAAEPARERSGQLKRDEVVWRDRF